MRLQNNLWTEGVEEDALAVNLHINGGLRAIGDMAAGASVPVNTTFNYLYVVPDNSAPAGGDFNSVVYGYTSATAAAIWPSAGLVGVLHIVERGSLKTWRNHGLEALPEGVDQVVPMYWMVSQR